MTDFAPRAATSSEPISMPNGQPRMAKFVCLYCSHIVEDPPSSPSQCPACGRTFPIADDSTHSGVRMPSTVMAAPAEPPQQIGRYIVERELGKGGFGIVYRAWDPELEQPVAIKIPRPDTGQTTEALARFAREGKSAAKLRDHAGIVRILTVEHVGEIPFIVSEFVDGTTLSHLLKDGQSFTFEGTARLVKGIAEAIAFAHSKQVIHRDIKPSNVMITKDGSPRLVDFGLARRETMDETITVKHQILGTPAYMSPEQAKGDPDKVDYRTDIYSLGVLLYQLLTGDVPFHGEHQMVLAQVIAEDPRRPKKLNAAIPIDLETICQKAMEKEAKSRYQTAGELAEELDCYLENRPIKARPITRLERAWRWSRRHPARAGLIASVVLLLALSTGGAFGFAAVADQGRKEAVKRELAEAGARRSAEDSRDKEAELRKLEAQARKAAEAAEKRIKTALDRNQELLSRAYVERGERYIRAPESSDEYNPIKALPWMLAAMKLDGKNPDRLVADRIRLRTQLDWAPRIERMWFSKGGAQATGVSPKRDLFFIARSDGTVDVWRTDEEGPPIVSLTHPSPVDAATFSPDGSLLATGSVDGVRIWQTKSGKLEKGPLVPRRNQAARRPSSHGSETGVVAFSHSGHVLFAATMYGELETWDCRTWEPIGPERKTRLNIISAEFVDSDRLLVLTGADGTIHVQTVQTAAEKHTLRAPEGICRTPARVSPNGHWVAAITSVPRVFLWDIVTGEAAGDLAMLDSEVPAAAATFSPGGELLATASSDGAVRMWKPDEHRLLWRRQLVSGRIGAIEFSPDGSLLAVTNFEKKLCVVAASTGKMVAEPVSDVSKILSAVWIDSGRILTVNLDGAARLWSIEGRFPTFAIPHVNEIGHAAISADRRALATAENDKNICLVRIPADGRLDLVIPQTFAIGDLKIDSLALADDGSRLAVSGERQVSVFDSRSGKQVAGPLVHSENVILMRFSPDGEVLICISRDGRAAVWNLQAGRRLYEPVDVSKNFVDLDIDRNGAHCAVAAMKGVTVWEVPNGRHVRPGFLAESFPKFVRFLDQPGLVFVANSRGAAQFWDIKTDQPVRHLPKRNDLRCIAVSGDKSLFLTGYKDGMARLWHACDGSPASPPFDHPCAVRRGVISNSNHRVVTLCDDSRLYFWDARTAETLAMIPLQNVQPRVPTADQPVIEGSWFPLLFFSADDRFFTLLSKAGLLACLRLDPALELPSPDEIATITGEEFDEGGDLRILPPDDLAARWQSNRRKLAASGSSSPAGRGLTHTDRRHASDAHSP